MIEIDGYTDLVRIGAGGLGDVYRATRRSTGGTVAIKVLRDVSDSSVAWHRTRRELTALVSLSGHGHVVQLLELLDLPTGPALVMEYAPGGSVGGLLARHDGRLTVAEAVLVGRQTAAALAAAHEQGIVHRDLKPQNLLIDAYGQVKLCDFGIASLARSEEFRTRTSALSMRYASPEDLDDEGEITAASDVYSLGATLLHLVHGSPPTLRDRLAPWTPPAGDQADPSAVDGVIADCLQPAPGSRPPAREVLDRLEAIDWMLPDRCRALPIETESIGNGFDEGVEGGRLDAGGAASTSSAQPDWFDPDTSAATVVRPDRVPPRPSPSQPAARARLSPWGWAAVAVAVAGVLGGAVALWWPSGDDEASAPSTDPAAEAASPPTTVAPPTVTSGSADASPSVSVVERPDGLPPLERGTWPFGEPGECLVQVNGVDELMPVDCGEPHDLQRFAVAELDGVDFPPGAAFSSEAVRVTTDDACRDAFVAFVGLPVGESVFDVAITRPSPESFARGDRRYQCLLGVPGSHVVGDAAAGAQ